MTTLRQLLTHLKKALKREGPLLLQMAAYYTLNPKFIAGMLIGTLVCCVMH